VAALSAPAACAPRTPPNGLQPVVTERLYFGRNIRDTLGVTDSAWGTFVREVVGARLEGFTFWTAEGAWRGTPEPSFVLEVVHPARSASSDSAIVVIIAEYKRRFNQESVLRVVTNGRASY
ncbi:MAG TPA: DUF3574 domain-containing protein, partial [Gemmatimonadales bacterium]|nr:DUF3574 domain-containing protein [Gemmatimonadales bacterium]